MRVFTALLAIDFDGVDSPTAGSAFATCLQVADRDTDDEALLFEFVAGEAEFAALASLRRPGSGDGGCVTGAHVCATAYTSTITTRT